MARPVSKPGRYDRDRLISAAGHQGTGGQGRRHETVCWPWSAPGGHPAERRTFRVRIGAGKPFQGTPSPPPQKKLDKGPPQRGSSPASPARLTRPFDPQGGLRSGPAAIANIGPSKARPPNSAPVNSVPSYLLHLPDGLQAMGPPSFRLQKIARYFWGVGLVMGSRAP